MKKIISFLFATVFIMPILGQTETETIKTATDLILNKKYESAFKLLQDFDQKNGSPDVVLLKEEIAINYFVTSMMHQIFAFKDLEKNESIVDYRGKEGSFGMYPFPVNEILDSLIKIYPTNFKLYKGLGDFYYDVQQRYEDKWLIEDSIISDLIIKNYQVVIDHNLANYNIYFITGLEFLQLKKNKESIPFFLKSIELKKDFADAHYNVAYAYLFVDDRENALKYAKNSLKLYTDASSKSDAARMIGEIYSELKDDKNAIINYELANKIDPENYYNLKPLLNLYVKTENSKSKQTLIAFFNLDPTNPTIYNDLNNIYYDNKKGDDLIAFLKEQLSTNKDNSKVLGSLYFYLAKLYLDTDKKIAKEYFITSKEIFSKIFNADHTVFKAIDEGIKQTENN